MADYSEWEHRGRGVFRREIDGHVLTVRPCDGVLLAARLVAPTGQAADILCRNRRAAVAWAIQKIEAFRQARVEEGATA